MEQLSFIDHVTVKEAAPPTVRDELAAVSGPTAWARLTERSTWPSKSNECARTRLLRALEVAENLRRDPPMNLIGLVEVDFSLECWPLSVVLTD